MLMPREALPTLIGPTARTQLLGTGEHHFRRHSRGVAFHALQVPREMKRDDSVALIYPELVRPGIRNVAM